MPNKGSMYCKYRWGEEKKAAMVGYEASTKEGLLASEEIKKAIL